MLALLGALYVLRIATVKYSLDLKSKGSSASLGTSSPGLVMITLGVATVVCALYSRSYVELDPSKFVAPPQISVQFKPVKLPPQAGSKAGKANAADTPTIAPGDLAGKTLDQLAADIPPFHEGSSELTADQKTVLDAIGSRLRANPQAVINLTAGVPANEPVEVGITLAVNRTELLKSYLLAQNVTSGQVRSVSWGKEPPLR